MYPFPGNHFFQAAQTENINQIVPGHSLQQMDDGTIEIERHGAGVFSGFCKRIKGERVGIIIPKIGL